TDVFSNGAGEPLYTRTSTGLGTVVIAGWKDRDERGQVAQAAEPFYSFSAGPVPLATTRVQTFHYDALGRLDLQTLPNGAQKQITRQGLCQTVNETSELAPVTSCVDGLGRVAHTERTVGVLESVDARYNAADRITAMVL